MPQHKTRLDLYDNSWYAPGSFLKRTIWYIVNWIFFKSSFPYPQIIKIFLLKVFGAKIGRNSGFKPSVNIKYPWFLEIGDNVWIGEDVWIDNLAQVRIGNNVCISQGVYLLTGNHDYKKETFDLIIGPITIEDGVWIGAKSIICPGITLKSHSVITAGSVMIKNSDPYTIYQGNPAVLLRKREISSSKPS